MKHKSEIIGVCVLTITSWLSPSEFLYANGHAGAEPTKSLLPELKIEKFTLDNGLTVVLHEKHMIPLVAVNVLYNVGSKDDPPGRSGLAHMVEHLMFGGSLHLPQGPESIMYAFSTQSQGLTVTDWTEYYTTVSKDALELLLWAEADRMGFLLPELTRAKLENQRPIVKNERHEKHENAPLGDVLETQRKLLYPVGHPYRHETIGSLAHIASFHVNDIYYFYNEHYVPNNAFLCVVGDFDSARVRQWIQRYFGPLRRAARAARPKPDDPDLAERRHVTLKDRISYGYTRLIWKTVPALHPDQPALDVLATVLAGLGKGSRLYRALVLEQQLATGVEATHEPSLLAGTLSIDVFAKSGQFLADSVRVIDSEIERIKKEGPAPKELRKAQIDYERYWIGRLGSVTSAVRVLNLGAATGDDPLAYQVAISRRNAVTPQEVIRVARKYLGAVRIEVDVVPGERTPTGQRVSVAPAVPSRKYDSPLLNPDILMLDPEMPEVGPTPHYTPPKFERRKLSNGLELRIVERHGLPLVTLNLVIKSGETATPQGKAGLCSIVLAMLAAGTKSRDALQLEELLMETGTSLQLDGWLESSSVNLIALTPYLGRALDLFADEILNPALPEAELRRHIDDRLFTLHWRPDFGDRTAEDVFPSLLYGAHFPYGRPYRGTPDSINSISRDDVVAFYKQIMVPGNAVLVVVGDVSADAIVDALGSRLGSWARGPIPRPPDLTKPPAPSGNDTIFLIDKPGAVQSVVCLGRVGASVKSADRYIFRFVTDELSGRLHASLREDSGYTYGFNSSVSLRNGPGPFIVTGSVQTEATKRAIVDILKAMTDLTGPRHVEDEDITEIQNAMVSRWFERFETIDRIAYEISYLVSHDLPDDDYAMEMGRYGAITSADVDRVARNYVKPERMTILVVGDRSKIEGPLKSLPFVKSIRLLDAQGNLIGAPVVERHKTPGK